MVCAIIFYPEQPVLHRIWAGYVMVWLGAVGFLLMVASRLIHSRATDGLVHDDNTEAYVDADKPEREASSNA